jgi:chorismate synthase
MLSIPAVKAVEFGAGFEAARRHGSEVHDEIVRGGRTETAGFGRSTNRAGGTEGGMTSGEPLLVRVGMKPISTLMRPLGSVDLRTGAPAKAQSERSDVTAVAAMGVIAEAMAAIVLAQAMAEKFGGDSMTEIRSNYGGYVARINARWDALGRNPD